MSAPDDQQLVSDARAAIYERHLGPLPAEVVTLHNLTGVWPGGCLVQIVGGALGGLSVTATFGLSDPGMPAAARVEQYQVREDDGPGGHTRELTTRLVPRQPRQVAPGLAGYGYELLVLTPRQEFWPLMFLNWAVPAEILYDARILEGLSGDGLLSIEGIDLGDGLWSDFLVAPPDGLFPADHELPNGTVRLLVATAITRDELEFALEHGRPALMERLLASGQGQVSVRGRESVLKAAGGGARVLPFRTRRRDTRAPRPAPRPEPGGENPFAWLDLSDGERKAREASLRERAEAGDAQAACDLASSLQGGRPEELDARRAEAEHWFRVAAERGHGWGAFHLGSILLDRGEHDQAEHWFGQARALGLPI
jgi:Suppressor of fused protein (SUFU)